MAAGSPTLLVTGAPGKLGRRVVELLLESGARNVIATTRNPVKLADFAERGVDVRKAGFDAAALSSSSTDCLLYDLTGPELQTQPELAQLVSERSPGGASNTWTCRRRRCARACCKQGCRLCS